MIEKNLASFKIVLGKFTNQFYPLIVKLLQNEKSIDKWVLSFESLTNWLSFSNIEPFNNILEFSNFIFDSFFVIIKQVKETPFFCSFLSIFLNFLSNLVSHESISLYKQKPPLFFTTYLSVYPYLLQFESNIQKKNSLQTQNQNWKEIEMIEKTKLSFFSSFCETCVEFISFISSQGVILSNDLVKNVFKLLLEITNSDNIKFSSLTFDFWYEYSEQLINETSLFQNGKKKIFFNFFFFYYLFFF